MSLFHSLTQIEVSQAAFHKLKENHDNNDVETWMQIIISSSSSNKTNNDHDNNKIVSFVLEIVSIEPSTDEKNKVTLLDDCFARVHPIIYDCLSQFSQSINDQDPIVTEQNNDNDEITETTMIPIKVIPMLLEPWWNDYAILDSNGENIVIRCFGKSIPTIKKLPSDPPLGCCIKMDIIYNEYNSTNMALPRIIVDAMKQQQVVLVSNSILPLKINFDFFILCYILDIIHDNESIAANHDDHNSFYQVTSNCHFDIQIIDNSPVSSSAITSSLIQDSNTSIGTFEQVTSCPGYESLLQELIQIVAMNDIVSATSHTNINDEANYDNHFNDNNERLICGILLTGCPGVGKSRLVSCLARHYQTNMTIHFVSVPELLLRAETQDSNTMVQELILSNEQYNIRKRNKCLIILEDFHCLSTSDDNDNTQDMESITVQNAIIQAMHEAKPSTIFIATSSLSSKAISNEFTKIERLDKEIQMLPPTQEQRITIWEYLLSTNPTIQQQQQNIAKTTSIISKWSKSLASMTAGCVAADLCRILRQASLETRILPSTTTTTRASTSTSTSTTVLNDIWNALTDAARLCIPSQLAQLDVQKPTMIFDEETIDIATIHDKSFNAVFAGYSTLKKRIFRTIVVPWKMANINNNNNNNDNLSFATLVQPTSGVLFHGPSGCGKTLAVSCLASSLQLPMIQVRASDILDKWLGGSEAILRDLFARANAAAPCILCLDEIDSIATNRATSNNGNDNNNNNDYGARILSTLLNEMDGISSNKGVLVVACTNRVDTLDAALLRPGRLQEHLHLDIPTQQDLVELLQMYIPKSSSCDDNGDDFVNVKELAMKCFELKMTGADIQGLCRDVCMMVLNRKSKTTTTTTTTSKDNNVINITSKDFEIILSQRKK